VQLQLTQRNPRFISNGTGNTWTHECQHPGVLGTNWKAFDRGDDGPRETTFFFQGLSVAAQRFNAACPTDTFAISEFASWPFQTSSVFNILALGK